MSLKVAHKISEKQPHVILWEKLEKKWTDKQPVKIVKAPESVSKFLKSIIKEK